MMKVFYLKLTMIFVTCMVFVTLATTNVYTNNNLYMSNYYGTNYSVPSFNLSNAIYQFTCNGLIFTNPSGNPYYVAQALNRFEQRRAMLMVLSSVCSNYSEAINNYFKTIGKTK